MKLTFKSVAAEICKRERSESREVNITDVSRVLRHLLEILAEQQISWIANEKRPHDKDWSPVTIFLIQQVRKRIAEIQKELLNEKSAKSRKGAKK